MKSALADCGFQAALRKTSRMSSRARPAVSEIPLPASSTFSTGLLSLTVCPRGGALYTANAGNTDNQTDPGDDGAAWLDHGRPRTQGRFRYYQQFLLENKTRAIEGLIVSTGETPGIGFRNHTLPPSSTEGYSWTEQILWLEPQTEYAISPLYA